MSDKKEVRYMTSPEQHDAIVEAAERMGMNLATFARYAALKVARES